MASSLLLSTPIYSLSHHSNNLKFSSFHKLVQKFPIFTKTSTQNPNPFKSLHILSTIEARASFEEKNSVVLDDEFRVVGEDAANFDISKQKIESWVYFTVILGVVLFALDAVWIDSSFGFGYGKAFVDAVSGKREETNKIRQKKNFGPKTHFPPISTEMYYFFILKYMDFGPIGPKKCQNLITDCMFHVKNIFGPKSHFPPMSVEMCLGTPRDMDGIFIKQRVEKEWVG